MTNLSEQRLWVVVHLLYPNSSQALDVYYTILSLVTKKSDPNYPKKLFKKLAQFFHKTPAVRSSQPFQVFEGNKLDNWNVIYKRSPKTQILAICGLVVFRFSISELAQILKISEQKIKFVINQSFKKTSQLSIVKPAMKTDFAYRKKDENLVSYLFTNENLVGHGLGILSAAEKERVEQGLSLYKQLVPLQSYYKEIIDEIQNLSSGETNPYFTQAQETIVENEDQQSQQTISFDFFRMQKKFVALSAVSIIFILVVMIRPSWMQNISFKQSNNNSIVMQEIKSQPFVTEKESAQKASEDAINLHEMPVAKNETQENIKLPAAGTVAKNEVVEQAVKATTETKPVAKVEPKPAKPVATEPEGKKVSGLYRASITVSDLDTIAPRITEKLVAMGGKKAGEVELGWKKTASLAYYHVLIPEENLEAVKTFIGNFGKLNIQFENHPRLLPAGTNRIILEVKESE